MFQHLDPCHSHAIFFRSSLSPTTPLGIRTLDISGGSSEGCPSLSFYARIRGSHARRRHAGPTKLLRHIDAAGPGSASSLMSQLICHSSTHIPSAKFINNSVCATLVKNIDMSALRRNTNYYEFSM